MDVSGGHRSPLHVDDSVGDVDGERVGEGDRAFVFNPCLHVFRYLQQKGAGGGGGGGGGGGAGAGLVIKILTG